MRLIVGLLIAAAVYQCCFRYEHWPSREKEGLLYQHDNLTGATRLVKPGAETNWLARILGPSEPSSPFKPVSEDGLFEVMETREGSLGDTPEKANPRLPLRAALRQAEPIPVPRHVVIASTEPPVPMAMLATNLDDVREEQRPFAVKQVDLNKDGSAEEIIQNAVHSDGLLDISIVKNGREIFYGRGRQISLLPSSSTGGWSDIALHTPKGDPAIYRYHSRDDIYKAADAKPGT